MPSDLRVAAYPTLDALPPSVLALFGLNSVFSTQGWYRACSSHALSPGAATLFVVVSSPDRTLAVFPLLTGPDKNLASLTTPYTCIWQPLLAAGLSARHMAELAGAFARFCRAYAMTRLDALDPGEAFWPALNRAARAARLVPLGFDHFGNWHEILRENPTWDGFLAARPGALRESIRRKSARLLKDASANLEIISTSDDLARGIAAYQDIYASSWKPPEPFPDFNPAFMREAALAGSLRLAILHRHERPVAAQLWTVHAGVATLMKLAHRRDTDALSPGTVLTALTIKHMLHAEPVAELDFGRGDDAYKALWVTGRRQRTGLILANPTTPTGIATLARHALGRLRKLPWKTKQESAFFFEKKNQKTFGL